jgi:hypothetical protein
LFGAFAWRSGIGWVEFGFLISVQRLFVYLLGARLCVHALERAARPSAVSGRPVWLDAHAAARAEKAGLRMFGRCRKVEPEQE